MKLYKSTAILLAIAFILGAVFFLLSKKDGREYPIKKDTQALKADLNDISEIGIEHKGESFKISRTGSKWTLLEPSGIKYDQAVIDGLPLSLEYLSFNKLICENPAELSTYGLDRPSLITVKTSSKKAFTIEVGNPTSTGENYYIKVKDDNKVYTIDGEKADSILLTKSRVKDKNVLSFRRELKLKTLAEDISGLSFYRSGYLIFSASKDEGGIWSVISPKKSKADNKEINNILNALVRVMAKDFIDSKTPEPGNYGLSDPAYCLEFTNSDGKKKLFIGNEKVAGSEFYAKTDGSGDVFSLEETGFDFLDKPLKDFLAG